MIVNDDQTKYFCNQLEYYNSYAQECVACPFNLKQLQNTELYCDCSTYFNNAMFIVTDVDKAICQVCPTNSVYYQIQNECHCTEDNNYFSLESFSCILQCGTNQILNSTTQKCITCPQGSESIGNITCNCTNLASYYEKETHECIICPTGSIILATYCSCTNTSQVFNIYLKECVRKCELNQVYSKYGDICTSCPDNFQRSQQDMFICNCTSYYQSGFYIQDKNQCILCPENSKVDTQDNTCICNDDSHEFQMYLNTTLSPFCKLQCKQNQYIAINNTKCISCPQTAQKYVIDNSYNDTCLCVQTNSFYQQDKNLCISCKDNSIANNSECTCQRTNYTYDYDNQYCTVICDQYSIKVQETYDMICYVCGTYDQKQITSKKNKCNCNKVLPLSKYDQENSTCVRDGSKLVIVCTAVVVIIVFFIPITIINLKSFSI